MKLTWRGHACFILENDQGMRIAMDPYDASVGYPMRPIAADAVLMSHGHHDHCCREMLAGDPQVIDTCGQYEVQNVRITGFPSFHDDQHGALRGKNVLFLIEMDGVRLLHAGDLGHPLSSELIEKIGPVDVLMIPVGGTYTLTGEQAAKTAQAINAQVTIPMHFKASCVGYPITDAQPFLKSMNVGNVPEMKELLLNPESIRALPGVVMMDWQA